jgi:hypothetical protein
MNSFLHMPAIEKWNESLPAQLAARRNFNLAVDFCRDLTSHMTDDGHGLVWFVTGPLIFEQRYGHAPVVLVNPGDFIGNQVLQKNQEIVLDKFNFQQAGKAHAKRAIYASWTDDIKTMLRDEHDSLDYRPIHEHYEALFLAFPVTSADISKLKAAVQKPYQRTDNIEAFLKEQKNNLVRLADNNHALNDEMAIQLIKSAFTTTPTDIKDFEACFDKFILDNPLAEGRTPARFTSAVAVYVKNALPHFVAKRATSFMAKAAEQDIMESTELTDEQTELHALRAEKAKWTNKPSAHPPKSANVSSPQPSGAPKTARVTKPGAPRFYCWSCGCDFPIGGEHYSHERCKKKKPGHQNMATYANQMGGKKA